MSNWRQTAQDKLGSALRATVAMTGVGAALLLAGDITSPTEQTMEDVGQSAYLAAIAGGKTEEEALAASSAAITAALTQS